MSKIAEATTVAGIEQKGMTFPEFQRKFGTEQACREFMFQLRWPEGFRCPKCHGQNYYHIAARHLFQCADPACRHQASLTAGTVMHKTRTPMRHWFWAVYMVAGDNWGYPALAISKHLGIPYLRAWAMLHKIRKAMGDSDANNPLGNIIELAGVFFTLSAEEADYREKQRRYYNPWMGPKEAAPVWLDIELEMIVEKEETGYKENCHKENGYKENGHKENHHKEDNYEENNRNKEKPEKFHRLFSQLEKWAHTGHLAPGKLGTAPGQIQRVAGIPVLAAMTLGPTGISGHIKMQVVREFGEDQAEQFVGESTGESTGEAAGQAAGDKTEVSLLSLLSPVSTGYPFKNQHPCIKYIEQDWEHFKRFSRQNHRRYLKRIYAILGKARSLLSALYFGMGKKHLQRYLDEFCYRFNRYGQDGQLFELLLGACIQARPLTYAALLNC